MTISNMKKIYLIVPVLMFACASFAQQKSVRYSYAEWHIEDCHAHFYNDSIKLLPPNKMSNLNKNNEVTILKDANGEKIIFASDLEVINYISKKGWTFIQAVPLSPVVVRHYFKKEEE